MSTANILVLIFLIFSHILFLWTFAPHRKQIQGRLISPPGTHVPFGAPLFFPSNFIITWRKLHLNLFNNFQFLIGFLRMNWNGMFWMFTVLVSQLYQAFKFFTKLVILTGDSFFTTQTSHLSFLCKKKEDKRYLLFYARKRSSVWISIYFEGTSQMFTYSNYHRLSVFVEEINESLESFSQ